MNNLGTLYQYELKKILKRKLVLASLLLGFLPISLTILSALFGNSYLNGEVYMSHYDLYFLNQEHERALSGREIGQQLLEEMVESNRKLKDQTQRFDDGLLPTNEERQKLNEFYYTYAAPYKAIYNFAKTAAALTSDEINATWEVDENNFYERRTAKVHKSWEEYHLTDTEKNFLEEKEQLLEKPFVFAHTAGWQVLLDSLYSIGLFVLFVILICLSGMFPVEHSRRTDQLILCTKEGKNTLYFAKILAGISFSAGTALIFTIFSFILALSIYGTDGFSAAFQLAMPVYSLPLTMGQAVLLSYAILLLASILLGICVMLLSELLHNSTATLAVLSGILILTMVLNIPEQYRLLSQIWDCLPSCSVAAWVIFRERPYSLFGLHLAAWQFIPALYAVLSCLFAAIGKPLYGKYQVTGR